MARLDFSNPRFRSTLLKIVLVALLAWSFCLDFSNTSHGGAIDLRNRITGVRLLTHHIDPYFYKWREPAPPEYCDVYNNLAVPVSKTTVTPAFLLLHLPFASAPYRLGQFLWFFTQWLFLVGTGILWLRRCPPGWPRAWLALFLVGFTYTAAWRLHVERGQSYVLLLFLLAAWLSTTLRGKDGNPFLAGLLAGLLVALRPSFLILAPFLLVHRRGQVPGAILGLVLAVGLPLLWKSDCWTRYAAAMQTQSELYRSGIDPEPIAQRVPPYIEGARTLILATFVAIPYADSSIYVPLRALGFAPVPVMLPLVAILSLFFFWLWYSRNQPLERLLLGVVVWLVLTDPFLPAYRNSYNDVLVINLVALGLIAFVGVSWGVGICFLALLMGWLIDFFAPMHDWMINLPTDLYLLGAAVLLFDINSSFRSPRV